jgi:hypothetical protein
MATLAGVTGDGASDLERERDAILERLGVVAIPGIPLERLAAESV